MSETEITLAEQKIAALERRLYDAMIRNDHAELADLIDERATYVHSNGVEETKEEYLQRFRDGAYEYDRVDVTNVKVHIAGGLAISTGRVLMSVGRRGDPKALVPLISTLVWMRSGERWCLLRRHATRLPVSTA